METQYQVAIYCRLSRDDDRPGESMSIETQKSMLTDYCEANGYPVFDYYIDDGYTGTNFNREEFQRLLSDIESGHVNMVLTKDLSRLGRDYILMGYYTEIFFPSKGVRYVALTDGFDSQKASNDIAPFMNILNDMYARDISRKVKSAKLQRAKKGLFVGSEAPYGYTSSNGHLEINPETALVVQLIFQLALQGKGESCIAKELQNRKITNPSSYKRVNKAKNTNSLQPVCNSEDTTWSNNTVGTILSNRVYLGELRYHRTEILNHKTKQIRKIPEEEQIIIMNAHPPIIDEAVFQEVGRLRAMHISPASFRRDNMFRGLLFCDCCGSTLSIAHRRLKNREEDQYRCVKHYYKPKECPKTHVIYHSNLTSYVLQQLHALARSLKRRKITSRLSEYENITALNAEILNEIIERIDVGHISHKTQISRAVKITWRL